MRKVYTIALSGIGEHTSVNKRRNILFTKKDIESWVRFKLECKIMYYFTTYYTEVKRIQSKNKTLLGVCHSVSIWCDAMFKNVLSLGDANSKTLLKWDDEFKNVWTDHYSATILIYLVHLR